MKEKHNHKYGQACNSLCSKTPSNESWEEVPPMEYISGLGLRETTTWQEDLVRQFYPTEPREGFRGSIEQFISKQISEAYLKGLNEMREIQSKGRGEQSQSSVTPENQTGSFGNSSPIIGKWPGPVTGNY